MATASTASLVDALCRYRLLEPAQLEELQPLQARLPDPEALVKELMQRGWLTPYQVNQLPSLPPAQAPPKVADAWLQQVAALPAKKQVEAVAARLKELNPDFDGQVTPKMEHGVVVGLVFVTDSVSDLSPVRALAGLKALTCNGSGPGTGKLSDLTPLKGLRLMALHCSYTQVGDLTPLKDMKLWSLGIKATPVADLSPLKEMKLTWLACDGTQVADLSPLRGMPLAGLDCSRTPVADLAPLKDMKMMGLYCGGTQVADLSPLKGMPLTHLRCEDTQVSDLSHLRGMPLKELQCDFKTERDAEMLRSLKTLEKINNQPAKEFWKKEGEKKLGKQR